MFKLSSIIPTLIFTSLVSLVSVQAFTQSSTTLTPPADKHEFFDVYLKGGGTLKVRDIDGLGYIDDMILGRTEDMKRYGLDLAGSNNLFDEANSFITPRGVIRYPRSGYLWPNGIIPYEIHSELSSQAQEDFEYAVQHWNSKTNIKLIPRNNESDYLEIKSGGGCSSWVGRQGGRQILTLASHCGRSAAVHEVGHAVGMFHEQNRIDRDQHVNIVWNNIVASTAFNFQKIQANQGQDFKRYDHYSIMHYRIDAFTTNGNATIAIKDPNVDVRRVGNSNVLSSGDIASMAFLYGARPGDATVYNGALSTNDAVDIQPNNDWFEYDGGFLAARLSGPAGTDFELELQKWNDSVEMWETAAESTNSDSSESIDYQAASGFYRFIIYSYNNESKGSYIFELNQ